jgi:hypothetical protein
MAGSGGMASAGMAAAALSQSEKDDIKYVMNRYSIIYKL